MIRDLMKKIEKGEEVRKHLIELKSLLKENDNKHALLLYLNRDLEIFYKLLKHEDPKVRKNTAIILGKLSEKSCLEKLFEAYEAEETLFVKSAYLSAIKEYDYREYVPKLREKMEGLEKLNPTEAEKKHVGEELKILTDMLVSLEGVKKHRFTGYHKESKIILLTNRNFKQITLEQLKDCRAKEFNAGIIARTSDLEDVLKIRTFSELLFLLEDVVTCPIDSIEETAKSIAQSSLLRFLQERHEGSAPFYFRIECKTKMDLAAKSVYTKKLAAELERLTKRQLINSTSNYEIELRLVEKKDRTFQLMLKLFTLKDDRFTYRKNAIASSIQPVNAALVANLAKEYLVEKGQVLDPFCGVGTMLVERHKVVSADTMYGLDIYGEAIANARENTELAHVIAHYINRDFFDFKHEYLFDEIITNMPRAIGHKGKKEITELYEKFFQKVKEHIKENGILILHVYHKEILEKALDKKYYEILKKYEISKKEEAYLYILKRK